MEGSLSLPDAAGPRRWPEGQFPPRAGSMSYEPQPIGNELVGLGFPHPAGRYRPEGSAFTSPGCWSYRDIDGFLTRGWKLVLPRCGGTSALAPGAPLAARWLHEPQPISSQPVGLGFPHPAGRYRPRGSAVGWGFHILRGGIDPGDLRFRSRVVGVV